MAQRPVIGFAHRGAPAPGVRENSLDAFAAAVAGGARALESDVWLTGDGVPVLLHDGYLGHWPRRRTVAGMRAVTRPAWLPTLAELYERCGPDVDLSLDVKDADPGAAEAVVYTARAVAAEHRLWLCGNVDQLSSWRSFAGNAHLVNSTGFNRGPAGPVADRTVAAGGDTVNVRSPEWSAEHVEQVHARGLRALAWDVQHRDLLDQLVGWGIDGVFSDSVPLLVDALG